MNGAIGAISSAANRAMCPLIRALSSSIRRPIRISVIVLAFLANAISAAAAAPEGGGRAELTRQELVGAPPAPPAGTRQEDEDGSRGPLATVPPLTEDQEGRAQKLEGRLKCPVCRTQSVRESTSFMALEMRAKIRELIRQGRSDDEVLAFFADRYGDYILLEPRKEGFGLAAYLLPMLAVLSAGVFLALAARRRRADSDRPRESDEPPLGASVQERVDEELKRFSP
jgi:cytochrome c-type biogenesis protein CcmH